MDKAQLTDKIKEIVVKKLSEKPDSKNGERPFLNNETVLLGGTIPIDSLDLATIIVELQSVTGRDPFAEGIIEFETIGELAELFET